MEGTRLAVVAQTYVDAEKKLGELQTNVRRAYLHIALVHSRGNVSKAAEKAGVSRNTFHRSMHDLKISRRECINEAKTLGLFRKKPVQNAALRQFERMRELRQGDR